MKGENKQYEGGKCKEERVLKPDKKYRHFKGNYYRVLYQARNSETLEDMVVYQALHGEHIIWVRPLSMFLKKVEKEDFI